MADAEQKGGGEEGGEVTDETLKKLHEQYLRNLKLQGVEGIRKAFIREVRAPCMRPLRRLLTLQHACTERTRCFQCCIWLTWWLRVCVRARALAGQAHGGAHAAHG